MAEYNIFLGTARKSVGDVTLYRKGGRQIARVRVRDISNPRSEGQSITRNFVAPVSKFYAPFADVLARSFEGLNKSDSYNAFQRTNIRLAKTNGWFLDKYTPFFPLPYQLSRGSLKPQVYYSRVINGFIYFFWELPELQFNRGTIGELSNALISTGARLGDVLTIIVVMKNAAGTYYPSSAQFFVNPASLEDANILGGDIWNITQENNNVFVEGVTDEVVSFAAIISRPSARGWLRSTQFLAVDPAIVTQLTSETQRASAIASYGPQNSGGGGGVYPGGDGEVFNIASASGRALLFYGGQYNAKSSSEGGRTIIKLRPANLDDYFYVRNASGYYMCGSSANPLNPALWVFYTASGLTPSDDQVIPVSDGSDMEKYLASIGVPL